MMGSVDSLGKDGNIVISARCNVAQTFNANLKSLRVTP